MNWDGIAKTINKICKHDLKHCWRFRLWWTLNKIIFGKILGVKRNRYRDLSRSINMEVEMKNTGCWWCGEEKERMEVWNNLSRFKCIETLRTVSDSLFSVHLALLLVSFFRTLFAHYSQCLNTPCAISFWFEKLHKLSPHFIYFFLCINLYQGGRGQDKISRT